MISNRSGIGEYHSTLASVIQLYSHARASSPVGMSCGWISGSLPLCMNVWHFDV